MQTPVKSDRVHWRLAVEKGVLALAFASAAAVLQAQSIRYNLMDSLLGECVGLNPTRV